MGKPYRKPYSRPNIVELMEKGVSNEDIMALIQVNEYTINGIRVQFNKYKAEYMKPTLMLSAEVQIKFGDIKSHYRNRGNSAHPDYTYES